MMSSILTPSEMAMIMKYAMDNSECAKVLSTFQYTTEKTTQHPDGILLTNTMFSRMYGTEVEGVTITAGKTGYTDEALNCLVSYAVKGDKSYICVTSHAHNKWHCVFDSFEIYGELFAIIFFVNVEHNNIRIAARAVIQIQNRL